MTDRSGSIGQFESAGDKPIPERIHRGDGAPFSFALPPYAIALHPCCCLQGNRVNE